MFSLPHIPLPLYFPPDSVHTFRNTSILHIYQTPHTHALDQMDVTSLYIC